MSFVSASEWRHPLVKATDTIDLLGFNGDRCRLSGKGMGDWGPILAPHSTGLFPAPFKTNWSRGALGQRYEGWTPQRRDIACTIHILNPDTGKTLDRNPDLWHLIYSRFRAMFSKEYESTIIYTSVDGERHLGVRMIQDPRPFVGAEFEGGDPHLLSYGSVGLLLGCENPFYVGQTEFFEWESDGQTGDFWFPMPYFNPASFMCFPYYYLTDRAQWTLPDYSFGWQEWGTGIEDLGKTVDLPMLREGENVHVDTFPNTETIIAENEAPVMERMNGRDFEYAIQPGEGDPVSGCIIRANGVTNPDGARCEMYLPRWYDDPFSTPTVFGPVLTPS
jgi:hypothetical protein